VTADRGADFSECGAYRYRLWRWWEPGLWSQNTRAVCWIMLNPSTADAEQDDPTIRRCVGFSRAWGYVGAVIVNLFALRTTDPGRLYEHPDPIGPDNSVFLETEAQCGAIVIAAWGTHGVCGDRGEAVRERLRELRVDLHHLGLTKDGHPSHPLYLPKTRTPELWAQ
jgi:hypothetical protein